MAANNRKGKQHSYRHHGTRAAAAGTAEQAPSPVFV